MLDVAESGLHAQGPGRTPTGAAASTGHTVAVLTLGRFEILLGQERRTEDDWPRRKVLRLFKCLITQRDRRLAREQAMALFWPDAPPEAASDSLRSSLTILRQTLRPVPDLIQADRYHIWINPAVDYWCDAEEFERLGRRALTREGEPALYEQALGLYDGIYLPTDLYDDWATARRDSLHELWFSLVGGLSAHYEQQGASDAAIAWLKQAAERDSCREDLQAQLMRLLAQTGRRVEALRQYQQLRESLRRELDVDPDPETTRLYERILRGEIGGSIAAVLTRPPSEGTRAHPLTAGTAGDPGPPPRLWQPARREGALVGREAEVATLAAALDQAAAGQLQFALIDGEAGTGKTRLAQQLLGLAQARDMLTLTGGAYEQEAALAYGILYDALRPYIQAAPEPVLRRQLGSGANQATLRAAQLAGVLPTLRDRLPDLPPPPPDSDRLSLFAAFAGFFAALAADWPVVLLLDDLQWADTATVELLHYLGRQLATSRVLLLATRREGEEDTPAATENLRRGLERAGVPITYLHLSGLDEAQFRPLLGQLLGAEPDTIPKALVDQLYQQTEGNPFFTGELVRYFRETGRLVAEPDPDGPRWQLIEPDPGETGPHAVLPSRVQEVLNRRFSRLSAAARAGLQAGAVLGRNFNYEELSATVDLGTEELVGGLEEALAARLVVEQGLRYRFAHPLIRDTVYHGLSGSRRAALHARAGAAIERLAGMTAGTERAAELAYHYTRTASTTLDKGLEYSLAAADYARTHYANAEAQDLYTHAARLARRTGSPAQRMRLAEGWGTLYLQTGQLVEAAAQFDALLRLAEDAADPRALVSALGGRGEAYRRQNLFREALADFKRGLAVARAQPGAPWALAGEATHLQGLVLVYGPTGHRDALNEASQELLAACERLDDKRGLAEALYAIGIYSKIVSGPVREAVEYFRRAVSLAQEIGDKDLEARNWMVLCGAHAFAGNPGPSETAGRRALALQDEIGDQTFRGEVCAVLGEALRVAGRYREALGYLQEALASPFFGGQQNAYMLLGRLYRDLQQRDSFIAHAAAAVESCRGTIWEVGALNWAAVALAWNGDLAGALAQLEANLVRARAVPIRFIEADTLRELAEGYLARGESDHARDYATQLRDMATAEPYQEYLAQAWRLLAVCSLGVGTEFALQQATAYLQQATTLAEQLGNPPLRWQIAAVRADLAARLGDGPAMREQYAAARAILQEVAAGLDPPQRTAFLEAPTIRAIEAGIPYPEALVPARPPSRLASRLAGARRRSFVGRQNELTLFRQALSDSELPFCVLHIHGLGGIGKTTLLNEFARQAADMGIPTVLIDGRNVDPTPEGFLNALRRALGVDNPLQALAARPGRRVLLVDTYETLSDIDAWLRDTFLPQLPDDTLVVLAGRNPPAKAWRSDPGWQELTEEAELTYLSEDEALDYLTRRNVPEDRRGAALGFTRGYPLALSLMVEVLLQQPDTAFAGPPPPDVVSALVERLVRDMPDERARAALRACAIVRTTSEPLLAALLGQPEAPVEFERLRNLSFIYPSARGLYPHDLAREALEADFRWRDPAGFRELHRRAHQYYVTRMKESRDDEGNYHDFVFLHKNPQVRAIFVWDQMSGLHTGPVRPGEWPILHAMIERHEGAEAAGLADIWFGRQPEGVTVIRDRASRPTGFIFHVLLRPADLESAAFDPATDAAARYLRTLTHFGGPDVASVVRWWMSAESYQGISPAQGIAFVLAARHVITTPDLAWSFHTFADAAAWEAILAHFDLNRTPEADFTLDGHRYGAFTHNWRARPPDSWLAMMAERETSDELATVNEPLPAPAPTPAPPAATERPASAEVRLDKPAFSIAVRTALHDLTSPAALAENPLTHTRLINDRVAARATAAERGATLRAVLLETIAPLQNNARDARLYNALHHTYVAPAGSQELAAERADVPFSTFRRHLKEGIDRLVAELWALQHAGE